MSILTKLNWIVIMYLITVAIINFLSIYAIYDIAFGKAMKMEVILLMLMIMALVGQFYAIYNIVILQD